MLENGMTEAALIETQLQRSLTATFALASIIREKQGTIEDFDALAKEMLKQYGGITNLQLAPDGVVSQIYPLSGNKEAICHDLLNDPERRQDALKTIKNIPARVTGKFSSNPIPRAIKTSSFAWEVNI